MFLHQIWCWWWVTAKTNLHAQMLHVYVYVMIPIDMNQGRMQCIRCTNHHLHTPHLIVICFHCHTCLLTWRLETWWCLLVNEDSNWRELFPTLVLVPDSDPSLLPQHHWMRGGLPLPILTSKCLGNDGIQSSLLFYSWCCCNGWRKSGFTVHWPLPTTCCRGSVLMLVSYVFVFWVSTQHTRIWNPLALSIRWRRFNFGPCRIAIFGNEVVIFA